jgi:paraquat-inducible protein A
LSGVYFFTAAVVFMILGYAWLNVFAFAPIRAEHMRAERARPVVGIGGRSALRNFLLALFILTAAICFALGIILPSIRFTTIYVWTNEHSIASIIYALYRTQEYFLAAVITVFSVFFPFLKLLYLLTLCLSPNLSSDFRQKSFSTMEWLGRYSMTDVMVLALMIFYMNSSGYIEARVLPGVYCFAASALMTMFAYGWANTPSAAPPAAAPVRAGRAA